MTDKERDLFERSNGTYFQTDPTCLEQAIIYDKVEILDALLNWLSVVIGVGN